MQRDRRLTRAYDQARVEQFDDTSRYVFISDCHRGDGRLSDEFTHNENSYLYALQHYYANGFTYVEVGDGDELWEYSSYRSIRRAHADVFVALKHFFADGRLILIWGNHNNSLRNRKYVEDELYTVRDRKTHETTDFLKGIEPCEAVLLKHSETGQEFLATHGHQGDFGNDQAWFIAMIAVRYFWRFAHALGVKNPISPAVNSRKRDAIERDYHHWVGAHGTPLICGHTHVFSFPEGDELPYFNAGSCVYPTYITALELADGQMTLVKWHVVADETGVLRVARQPMRGPAAISSFRLG